MRTEFVLAAAASSGESVGFWLLLWISCVAVTVGFSWRRGAHGVGLILAYLLNISLLHFVGAATYLAEGQRLFSESEVAAGLRESVWGLMAFAFGSVVIAPIFLGKRATDEAREEGDFSVHQALPLIYVMVGTTSYFALATFLGRLPTLNAIVAVGQQILLVGHTLACWKAFQAKKRGRLTLLVLIGISFPIVTVMMQGFLTYGAFALVIILSFVATLIRPKWKVVAFGLAIGYLGVSVFVSYSQERDEIREVVWGGATVSERIERVYAATIEMEWFNPNDDDHLEALDIRLNQNHLVGAAVRHLATDQDYADGQTITDSIIALVPRFLWPDKPLVAGSPEVVSEYTGIEFAPYTSVGIGHVLEFYINFGTPGVVFGFLLIGFVLTMIDVHASRKLKGGNWQGFTLLLLVGIPFLQVGGSLIELTTSAAASVLLALVINWALYRLQKRIGPQPLPPSPVPAAATE
jgi:hypothetical protein